jgi:hypothetical protein
MKTNIPTVLLCSLTLVLATSRVAAAQAAPREKLTSRVDIGWNRPESASAPIPGREPAASLGVGDGISVRFDVSRNLTTSIQAQVGVGIVELPGTLTVNGQPPVSLDGFRVAQYHAGIVYRIRGTHAVSGYLSGLISGIGGDIGLVPHNASVAPVKLYGTAGPAIEGGVRIKRCACDRIAIDAGVRWTMLRAQISGSGRLDLNPLTFFAGVAVRH